MSIKGLQQAAVFYAHRVQYSEILHLRKHNQSLWKLKPMSWNLLGQAVANTNNSVDNLVVIFFYNIVGDNNDNVIKTVNNDNRLLIRIDLLTLDN